MKLACDQCGGTGREKTESGRMDICSKCFGLGFVEPEDGPEEPETRKMVKHFYILMAVFAFILGLYYIGLYFALIFYGFSFLVTMVLFVGGHVVIFGGFLIFVTLRILRQNQANGPAK